MKKPKKSARSKLTGEALAAFEALGDLAGKTQLQLLDLGLGGLAVRMPEVVLEAIDAAAPVSVAEATERAKAGPKPWQDVKATLELQLRLVRARAAWEAEDAERAQAELKQIAASASSRRIELVLGAASRANPDWSAPFSLALLRAAAGSLASSKDAALSLVDAMTGAGEQTAAAMILGQLIAGGGLDRAQLAERVARIADPAARADLERQLG